MKFDHDPIRYKLHLDCIFEPVNGIQELTMEGIYKAEIVSKKMMDPQNPSYSLTDVGSILHARMPKGYPNPPHLYFELGLTEYRFWGSQITVKGYTYELESIRISDFEYKEIGLPEDWQPPVKP